MNISVLAFERESIANILLISEWCVTTDVVREIIALQFCITDVANRCSSETEVVYDARPAVELCLQDRGLGPHSTI